jgi:glutaconate CoA-transferase subunit A
MDEWVYGCPDRQAYIDHYIASNGAGKLNAIRAKSYFSAPANYGSAFTSCWDNNERERTMGITLEEMEKILEERGLLNG